METYLHHIGHVAGSLCTGYEHLRDHRKPQAAIDTGMDARAFLHSRNRAAHLSFFRQRQQGFQQAQQVADARSRGQRAAAVIADSVPSGQRAGAAFESKVLPVKSWQCWCDGTLFRR